TGVAVSVFFAGGVVLAVVVGAGARVGAATGPAPGGCAGARAARSPRIWAVGAPRRAAGAVLRCLGEVPLLAASCETARRVGSVVRMGKVRGDAVVTRSARRRG